MADTEFSDRWGGAQFRTFCDIQKDTQKKKKKGGRKEERKKKNKRKRRRIIIGFKKGVVGFLVCLFAF